MVKILHKYIVKEFVSSFCFGLIVFSSILLLDQVFQLIDLFLSKGVSLWIIFQLFALVMPNILSLTIPMAILFGVLLGYGRFSEDNEITVMKANGINYKTLSMPVITFICIISFGLVFFNHYLSPSTHMYFRTIYKKILTTSPLAKFSEKTIVDVGQYRMYAHTVNSKTNSMTGVNIYRFSTDEKNSDGYSIPWRIAASSATVSSERNIVYLKLYDGYWQRTDPNKPDEMLHVNFSTYEFAIPFGDAVDFSDVSLQELTSNKLREKINAAKSNDKEQKLLYTYTNEYWFRWVLAIAPVVFALVAIPIGIMAGKGGKAIGFGMSLGVIFIYYMLLVIAMNIGEKGYIKSCFIMWLPNLVLAIIGFLLFKKMSKK